MPTVLTSTDRSNLTSEPPDLRLLRRGVLLYIILWVFEGALRKWILPGLANPLLVVRDPLLLGLYWVAYSRGVFPRNPFIVCIICLGMLATFVSLATTNTPTLVTLFGLRAGYLHLPLIFLLPNILRIEDLHLIGKCWLAMAIAMAVLVVLQFRSGSGAFLNRGAGENTIMLESAFGHIRPSGTFSYTNGLTGFTLLTAAFFLQHLLEKRVYPRAVWLATIPSLLLLVVLSGSRLAAAALGLILAAVMIVCLFQSRYRASSLKLVALIVVAIMLAGSFAVFKNGIDVITVRFKSNKIEQNGFIGRYFEGHLAPFLATSKADWGGMGLGMGTNVAAGLLTGQRKFMFTEAEGEGGRVILESGPVVGMVYLMLRLCITIYVGAQAVRALREHAATLPFLIFSGCFNDLLSGQFSQATELGYATIAGGLCLVACRTAGDSMPEEAAEVEETPAVVDTRKLQGRPAGKKTPSLPAAPVAATSGTRTVRRGRSAYAARLHTKAEEEESGEGP